MEERNSRWVDGWVGGWMNGEGKEEKMKISILNSRWMAYIFILNKPGENVPSFLHEKRYKCKGEWVSLTL